MRQLRAGRVLGATVLATVAGCLDVPPHQPCAGDFDCDGWPAVATTPDCDDLAAAINPGAADDPTTAAIEDCGPGPVTSALDPVAALPAGWRTGEFAIEFDSTSKMPSSLRYQALELLAGEGTSCVVGNEESMGVSLFPAFAVHARAPQVGQLALERSGPALGTSLVTWTQALPAAATGFGCDAATTVTGAVRFTMHPGGPLIREDVITVSAAITTCAGCPLPGGGGLAFTSYTTFPTALDRYQLDARTATAFPPGGMSDSFAALDRHSACVTGGSAAQPQVALGWRASGGAGLRFRTTDGGALNHAAVFDWIRGTSAAAQTYRLVTIVEPEVDQDADCSMALRETVAQQLVPATVAGMDFVAGLGVYQPTTPAGPQVTVDADRTIAHGLAVRADGLGERGVTVWLRRAGQLRRLRRGAEYLVQRDPDGFTVVHLPALDAADVVTIAAPGAEPTS